MCYTGCTSKECRGHIGYVFTVDLENEQRIIRNINARIMQLMTNVCNTCNQTMLMCTGHLHYQEKRIKKN